MWVPRLGNWISNENFCILNIVKWRYCWVNSVHWIPSTIYCENCLWSQRQNRSRHLKSKAFEFNEFVECHWIERIKREICTSEHLRHRSYVGLDKKLTESNVIRLLWCIPVLSDAFQSRISGLKTDSELAFGDLCHQFDNQNWFIFPGAFDCTFHFTRNWREPSSNPYRDRWSGV